jgi:hypothetical protein
LNVAGTVEPYIVITGGPPPRDTTAHTGFVYHLFESIGRLPALIVYTHDPEAPGANGELLAGTHGRLKLGFYDRRSLGRWHPIISKLHFSNAIIKPRPRELARLIRELRVVRAFMFISSDHYLIMYADRLLEEVPDLDASVFLVDDPTVSADGSRDPVFRFRVSRHLRSLLRRCARRFVISDLARQNYEARFGLPFGVILPFVRDDHWKEFGPLPARPSLADDGSFRVFLMGSFGWGFRPSVECLAAAFDRVATKLGRNPRLCFAGNTTMETLLGCGFNTDQLESLGWLPTRREVVRQAYLSGCTFAPGVFLGDRRHGLFSFSGRISDLLLAGAPILVNWPTQSAVAAYFRAHGLPFLCDQLDADVMAKVLIQVAGMSVEEREELRGRYLKLVREFHLMSQARKKLWVGSPDE